MFESLPQRVQIYEVGPRDGLQNEHAFVPTEDKLALIAALARTGLERIEATSFVHPRWIPPLADADRVAAGLDHAAGPRYSALVPNERGLDRALRCGMREVAVFMSASVTHNQRNTNATHDESYARFEPIFATCAEREIPVRAYVSTAWGCPYEGSVDPRQVTDVTVRLLAMGAYEVSLGDTIGVGDPLQTRRLLERVSARVDVTQVALHMHDTRGLALANCMVGLDLGVTTFDTSVGGLGGCPYAPGASGNLATEDLVYALHRMGVETGLELGALTDAGLLAQRLLGRPLSGRTLRALASEREGTELED